MSDFELEQQRVSLHVDPGVCRFKAKIECWTEGMVLRCKVTSGCKHVQDFGEALGPMELMDVLQMPFSENKVYVIGGKTLKHSTCPLPMAALKGMEAAAGLALKRDVVVSFDK
ncbi:MAG: hypothetical protein LUQ16_07515 [Methanomassiliicoccales archaeon]|jgi:hypothetical protein|nr:hypothetical protein [Methanomassiliicoccales archaeon]